MKPGIKDKPALTIKQLELNKLKPWQDNPRINDGAVHAAAKSIESFGFNVPIICDQNYVIIAGHTRWKAAKQLGINSVPVIILTIDEHKRQAFAVADNKTAELADWDETRLKKILNEVGDAKIDLTSLGYSKAQLEAILEKPRNFDWKKFQQQFERRIILKHTILTIKIPHELKPVFVQRINELAKSHKIRRSDFAETAGAVFAKLLELRI